MQSNDSFVKSVQKAITTFDGAFGLGIISPNYPNIIIAARKGSPLVIGIGENGNYIASDQLALLPVTKDFIFLEEGDIAELSIDKITIYDKDGIEVNRPIQTSKIKEGEVELGNYKYFMQKEIFEQPQAIRDTLESRITKESVLVSAFGYKAKIFSKH
jgi:glucosamine--fructose-6-phosphate aminotransferase (isomerizing)